MSRLTIAGRLMMAFGSLLLVVAVIHLVITPVLRKHLLLDLVSQQALWVLEGPFLLNHVVVGILLVPIGLTTLYSARGMRLGCRWAWVIGLINAGAVLTLPFVLVLFMRPEHFRAVPFLVAAVLVTVVAVGMLSVVLWARGEVRKSGARDNAGEKAS